MQGLLRFMLKVAMGFSVVIANKKAAFYKAAL